MSTGLLVILGMAVMLIMALSLILFVVLYQRRVFRHQLELKTLNEQKQMELLQASIQSEEEERMRIAGELHDDVGAGLSSVRLFLHKVEKDTPNPELVIQSGKLLDESIGKIRNISHKLQPATLQAFGLYAALEVFAETLSRSGSLWLQVNAQKDLPRLQGHTELHIYRIVQELVTNAIKHAHANRIVIDLSVRQDNLIIEFVHDGKGLTEKNYKEHLDKKGAFGLKNIENRCKFISGKLDFSEMPDSSFKTTLEVFSFIKKQ